MQWELHFKKESGPNSIAWLSRPNLGVYLWVSSTALAEAFSLRDRSGDSEVDKIFIFYFISDGGQAEEDLYYPPGKRIGK
jgi:hypothetical protein